MTTMDRDQPATTGQNGRPDATDMPLGRDARVGAGRAVSDPTGTGASHPAKPDPLPPGQRAETGPSADGTAGQPVKQAKTDDTGSLSPVPATFAHVNDERAHDERTDGPEGTGPARPVAEGATAWGPSTDQYQTRAKDSVEAMHRQPFDTESGREQTRVNDGNGPTDAGNTSASQDNTGSSPPKVSGGTVRSWLPVALLVGLGMFLTARRRTPSA